MHSCDTVILIPQDDASEKLELLQIQMETEKQGSMLDGENQPEQKGHRLRAYKQSNSSKLGWVLVQNLAELARQTDKIQHHQTLQQNDRLISLLF